jgi:hypothetical protein
MQKQSKFVGIPWYSIFSRFFCEVFEDLEKVNLLGEEEAVECLLVRKFVSLVFTLPIIAWCSPFTLTRYTERLADQYVHVSTVVLVFLSSVG